MRPILVKVGTNVITGEDGLLNETILENLVQEISEIIQSGEMVILVSSGAMGAGRSLIQLPESIDRVARRQVLASVGQIKLMQIYFEKADQRGLRCAQVLATKEDFRDRHHYLNMKTCFEALLKQGVLPIVNENDVVSVDELMFTDNDELAALIASMMNAKKLILATSVDGVYDRALDDPQKKVIREVKSIEALSSVISPTTSKFGRGGMMTKLRMAAKLSQLGIEVHIVNGKKPGFLNKVLKGDSEGTSFPAQVKKTKSSAKRWIALSRGYEKGVIRIKEDAVSVLNQKIASLLPIGVLSVEGEFQKGDILRIESESGSHVGYGIAAYGHQTAKKYKGLAKKRALIHYDHLFLENLK